MFARTKLSNSLIWAFGGSIFFASMGVAAQDAGTQRVEITGSSIKRIAAEGALPVQTFNQADIQRSGATSVTDFLQAQPVMQGFVSVADSVGGGGGGTTTASIHGVGDQYTLVLLNGRRVAPSNSGTTIDLNSIPLAAIERVEILTDGASAIYGADAIAGVVNFILKSGPAPLTLDAKISQPEAGGGEKMNFSISKGFGDLDAQGFEVFLAASYDKTKQLKAKDRSFAKSGIISGRFGNLNYDFFNGSSRAVPPNVDVFGDAIGGFTDDGDPINSISFSPYYLANGDCPADHVVIGRQCFFDYTSTVEIVPESERTAVYGSGRVKLGASGWELFGDLAYTDVSTIARIAPYPAEFLLDRNHPYYGQYILPNLTPDQAAVAELVNVKYRLYDLGNRTYDYNTKALHSVVGTEGQLAGWDVRGAFTYSTQKQDQNYLAGFPLAEKFQAAIDSLAFDPFPYTVGTMPADQLAALRSTQYVGNYNTAEIEMVGLEGNIQKPMFQMGGGSAVLSLGGDYRTTGYKVTANRAVANAEILFDDPQSEYDLSRKSAGVYAEMNFPLSKQFEAQLAARYDVISGVTDGANDAHFGDRESAATFKLGGKWSISPRALVRASYGTGFRTATMLEIAQPKTDFGVTSGTYDCPFSQSNDPLGYIAAGYVCADNAQFEVFTGGNPDLKPEKSNQWNIGVVLQPTDSISVGLNYWSVEIKNAVSAVSEQLILGDQYQTYLDLYTSKFKQSNGLTYVAILLAPINIGRQQNEGIDWDFGYKTKFDFGKFEGRLAGTYLTKSRYTVPGTSNQWTTSLNKFGIDDAVAFRNIIKASATVGYGDWEHSLSASYRNGYKDQAYSEDDCVFFDDSGNCKAGALRVKSYSTFDWRTAWAATKNLSLVLGIENILDTDPPRSLRVNGAGHQLGYDPRYTSPFGRTYSLQATLKF